MGWAAEPGYYEDGAFGTRIENVMLVKKAQVEGGFGDKQFLEFEAITWVRKGRGGTGVVSATGATKKAINCELCPTFSSLGLVQTRGGVLLACFL